MVKYYGGEKLDLGVKREESVDRLRDVCVDQGYVPKECKLPVILVLYLVDAGEDPCAGCNINRSECGGRSNGKK